MVLGPILSVNDPFPIESPPYTTTHQVETTTNLLAHLSLNCRTRESPRGSSTPLKVGPVNCRSNERVSKRISAAGTGMCRMYRGLMVYTVYKSNINFTCFPGCCDDGSNAKTVCVRLSNTAGSQTLGM
jgi:hypothetical protein